MSAGRRDSGTSPAIGLTLAFVAVVILFGIFVIWRMILDVLLPSLDPRHHHLQ